ncbi:MAG: amino acid synthesis family protein [Actinobacteria bacterium]|nr:amino acid synthesis family protein [Actinomycetota bacterium]
MALEVRKVLSFVEEIRTEAGRPADPPLRKAAAAAVFHNPLAGRPYQEDLAALIDPSDAIGELLGEVVAAAIGGEAESYGKAAVVGLAGEQEHAVAVKTSTMGDAFRAALGGGTAWLPSVSKRCAPGATVDVPLCCKEDVWVRSHYDSIAVTLHDAPLPDELVVIVAAASRGRIGARVGGRTRAEAIAGD